MQLRARRSKRCKTSQRYAPNPAICSQTDDKARHLQAIVDPVADSDTGGNQHTLNHDQFTTLVGLRGFGLPHRDSTSVHSVAPTGDKTTDTAISSIMILT